MLICLHSFLLVSFQPHGGMCWKISPTLDIASLPPKTFLFHGKFLLCAWGLSPCIPTRSDMFALTALFPSAPYISRLDLSRDRLSTDMTWQQDPDARLRYLQLKITWRQSWAQSRLNMKRMNGCVSSKTKQPPVCFCVQRLFSLGSKLWPCPYLLRSWEVPRCPSAWDVLSLTPFLPLLSVVLAEEKQHKACGLLETC